MPIEVTMPKLSPTMETGVITQWLVKVGDQIKEGDVLAEIETDKATMPMKSYDDGTIVQLDHAAGDEVALGQRVMVLAKKGEDPQQVAASLGGGPAQSQPAATGKASSTPAKPEAGDRAADRSRGNGQQKPDAGNGRQPADEEAEDGSGGRRLKVSPLARKLAESSRIDLSRRLAIRTSSFAVLFVKDLVSGCSVCSCHWPLATGHCEATKDKAHHGPRRRPGRRRGASRPRAPGCTGSAHPWRPPGGWARRARRRRPG